MRGYACASIMFCLALIMAPTSAQQGIPSWVGRAGGFGAFANSDPFGFMSALLKLPIEEQRVFLTIIGSQLQDQMGMECNIFGGSRSCVEISADSMFAKVCKGHELKVDCAHADALSHAEVDPVAAFEHDLSSRQLKLLQETCPQCLENQRKMWCTQTVPACGSFESAVEGAILPALAKVSAAKDHEKDIFDSLADAVPDLADALALSLPCREMCEATVSTCSCAPRQATFGQLLDQLVDRLDDGDILGKLPEEFSRAVFGQLHERPVCELFAWSNTTGFSGACEQLPASCSLDKAWCDGSSGGAHTEAFQQLMASQIAKTLFGIAGDSSKGLWTQRQTVLDKADDKQVQKLADKYILHDQAGRHESASRSTAAAVLSGMLGMCLMMAAVAAAVFVFRRRQQAAEETMPIRRDGYIPMMDTNSNSDHAPEAAL